jgi:hypothetical protein
LTVAAPADARLRTVELDGVAVGVSDKKTAQLVLAGDSGSRSLRLEWSANELTAGSPELRVGGAPVSLGDVDFFINVPPGFGINASGTGTRESNDFRLPSNVSADPQFHGSPHHYRLAAGKSLDVHVVPELPRLMTWQHILLTALWLVTLLLATIGAPETVGCLAVIAVLVIGPAAGALLLIPIAILAWRVWRLLGVLAARSAGHEARAETS